MKKLIAVLLAVVMLLSLSVPIMGASDEAISAANALYERGLFIGTGTDADGKPIFALDLKPTRHEAVTMLVRLLGKEEEALAGNWVTPFTDVADWAEPYVGYAYANGLTVGTSETTFGGFNDISATEYLTFVLRSLGYINGLDFQWDKAWVLSDELDITDGLYGEDTVFTRGDVAILSYNALSAPHKGEVEKDSPSVDHTNDPADTPVVDPVVKPTPETEKVDFSYEINSDGTTCTIIGMGTYSNNNVVIPKTIKSCTVTVIGEKAFADCSSITSIKIPNTVTIIDYAAFSKCTNLKSITIPDSVTNIGDALFADCSKLESITLSENITSIGESVFEGCSSLKSISLPMKVTSIDDAAFWNCSSLTSITIPCNVTSIGVSAFEGCSDLTSVTIFDSMMRIGNYVFYDCDSLSQIIYKGTKAQWDAIAKDEYWDYASGDFVVYCEGDNSVE